jgi:hypothetical protein
MTIFARFASEWRSFSEEEKRATLLAFTVSVLAVAALVILAT